MVDAVADWQDVSWPCWAGAWCSRPTSTTCWPTGRSRRPGDYGDFPMHEDGIGMARAFEAELLGRPGDALAGRGPERGGFFHSADAGCSAVPRRVGIER